MAKSAVEATSLGESASRSRERTRKYDASKIYPRKYFTRGFFFLATTQVGVSSFTFNLLINCFWDPETPRPPFCELIGTSLILQTDVRTRHAASMTFGVILIRRPASSLIALRRDDFGWRLCKFVTNRCFNRFNDSSLMPPLIEHSCNCNELLIIS